MKALPIILILCICKPGFSQQPDQEADSTVLKDDTAFEEVFLKDKEKEVIRYMNMVRTQPKTFLKLYLQNAAQQLGEEESPEYKSLVKELDTMHPVRALFATTSLWKTARAHALDMGRTGRVGHSSSTGQTFEERVGTMDKAMGENCDYGFDDPLLIVTHLLIDTGIEDVGHRRNIFDRDFSNAGVSIQRHKRYGMNCVIDFSE
jgi:uncharacterized protein YkwD